MADSRRRDWRDAALVALAGLALLLIADALIQDANVAKGDDLIYELMADKPFETHSFPFAYRFLVPTLAHVLPFGNSFWFAWLAWLSTAACGGVAYVLMRRFAVNRPLAAGLALCLVLCPPLLVVSLRQGRNVDPETLLVMLAGGLAVADRRPLALAAIVVVGATIRESALFLIPFAYAYWAVRPLDRLALRQTAGVAIPGLAVYVAVRTGIPTTPPQGCSPARRPSLPAYPGSPTARPTGRRTSSTTCSTVRFSPRSWSTSPRCGSANGQPCARTRASSAKARRSA